jgi:hypothetical protein
VFHWRYTSAGGVTEDIIHPYIYSETLTTGWMISSLTPPAEVYLQFNTDYWADDILGDSTSRGISPLKH